MSEGMIAELLGIIREDQKGYEAMKAKAKKKGLNDLYNFSDGAKAALKDVEDMIVEYLGEDCPEEEGK